MRREGSHMLRLFIMGSKEAVEKAEPPMDVIAPLKRIPFEPYKLRSIEQIIFQPGVPGDDVFLNFDIGINGKRYFVFQEMNLSSHFMWSPPVGEEIMIAGAGYITLKIDGPLGVIILNGRDNTSIYFSEKYQFPSGRLISRTL